MTPPMLGDNEVPVERADQAEHGRLAATRRTGDRELAVTDFQVHAVECSGSFGLGCMGPKVPPPARIAAGAPRREGSWWPAWETWLAERSSGRVAPPPVGAPARGHPALADSPRHLCAAALITPRGPNGTALQWRHRWN